MSIVDMELIDTLWNVNGFAMEECRGVAMN